MTRRRSFESGHTRKFLLVVDDSAEAESALYYCAARIARSSGTLVMLYVIEPQQFQHWISIRETQIEEETAKARALFRLFRRKLAHASFNVAVEDAIREGDKAEAIAGVIAEDEDIAILVLGAATGSEGPGPLVTSLAAGKAAGGFPIPITVVPGHLTLEAILALA